MALPVPEAGLVISYDYLWRHEYEAGQEQGRKTRPCVIILAVRQQGKNTVVTIAPITHTPSGDGIEIPPRVKHHLGLDNERSGVVTGEVNEFTWPGFDLRPVAGLKEKYDYGFLPPKLFDQIRMAIIDRITGKRGKVIKRD